MITRRFALSAAIVVCLAAAGSAQAEEPPLSNWSAPPFWSPTTRPHLDGEPAGGMLARAQGMQAQAEALPTMPLPFVAVAPCRIVDTRVNNPDGFHSPNFFDDQARTFNFPTSADCPGLPATAGAYSINIQFRPMTQLSFLTAYPTGTVMPGVSTMTAGPAAWVQNAAIVPAGLVGAVDIYCQYAGRVVIDVNGYYATGSVVTSLNTKTGAVTLAEGSNIAITPSGNTLTISVGGIPGGTLPDGTDGQTLRSNGSSWFASSVLTNDGTDVGITGDLMLPATTTTAGQIRIGGYPFLHNYGPDGDPTNTFVGRQAGNVSMGGANWWEGTYNTAVGYQGLYSATTGYSNTAIGREAMLFTTTGYYNTALGDRSMWHNTTGNANTANGMNSLFSNTTGYQNTATGQSSLTDNIDGYRNTANGYQSLSSNTAGGYNTAIGHVAGGANTTGSDNTFLGALGDASAGDLTNATAVGYAAVVNASNKVRIGNAAVTVIEGQVDWSFPSDIRHKKDIRDLPFGLDLILQLRPVEYRLRDGNDRLDMGFVAQDIEVLLGEGYNILGIGPDPERMLSLRRGDLIAPLVKAIQEQQATIEAQQEEIRRLNRRAAGVEALQAQVAELGRKVQALLAATPAKLPERRVGD